MASPATNGNPWRTTSAALSLFLLAVASMWGMVSVHAEHPHKDAVGRPEYDAFRGTVQAQLERIEAKLDKALE